MPIVKGFDESYGKYLKEKNYIDNSFQKVAYRYGYDQIQIPILEYSTSFDETVVGKSPWPEWNSKGIFNFLIENYNNSYDEKPTYENVLLIPEGTTSVTRWLGDKINKNDYKFPIKMFYNLSCYRNELISELTGCKKREFHQFGFEILGTSCIQSDCEILNIVFETLKEIKIDSENIRIRINDISIYKKLCEESGINYEDSITLKEDLDFLAECKAGKHPEKFDETYNKIIENIKKYNLSESTEKKWDYILNRKNGTIDESDLYIFGKNYEEELSNLIKLQNEFKKRNYNIFIDLCVIRSHEYYTGISFEIDVIKGDKKFIEIAGGGRFDRLVSNFIEEKNKMVVPCTGFAFGVERVIAMLEELDVFNDDKNITISYSFKNNDGILLPKDDTIEAYFETLNNNEDKKCVNIYIDYNKNIGE